jgi:hypothetical protein
LLNNLQSSKEILEKPKQIVNGHFLMAFLRLFFWIYLLGCRTNVNGVGATEVQGERRLRWRLRGCGRWVWVRRRGRLRLRLRLSG